MVLKSSGNAYFQDNNFLMGDLRVIIQSVENDNFIVKKDHVSLTLLLTPHEAVNGFIYETFVESFDKVEGTNKLLPTKTFKESVTKMEFNNVTNQDFDIVNYKTGKMISNGEEFYYLTKVRR